MSASSAFEFEPHRIPGLLRLARMELELAPMFGGREVDLRTYEDLSRYFRDEVRDAAQPVYVAKAGPERIWTPTRCSDSHW